MLEAQAHQQIKTLLRQEESNWPHHLTLSRLVARSLRRRDTDPAAAPPSSSGTLVARSAGAAVSGNPSGAVLVLTAPQRRRLLQVERPRLRTRV